MDAFVHISTVYSNPSQIITEEKIYKSHINPLEFLEIAKYSTLKLFMFKNIYNKLLKFFIWRQSLYNSRDECLKYINKDLFPNTYTFTRNLAEKLVEKEFNRERLPTTIVRLGFVSSSYKEPFAGWFHSINSHMGKNILLASGLLRASRADPDVTVDIVPVDYVANVCITAASNTITKL